MFEYFNTVHISRSLQIIFKDTKQHKFLQIIEPLTITSALETVVYVCRTWLVLKFLRCLFLALNQSSKTNNSLKCLSLGKTRDLPSWTRLVFLALRSVSNHTNFPRAAAAILNFPVFCKVTDQNKWRLK